MAVVLLVLVTQTWTWPCANLATVVSTEPRAARWMVLAMAFMAHP